jgi:hypothetical protein
MQIDLTSLLQIEVSLFPHVPSEHVRIGSLEVIFHHIYNTITKPISSQVLKHAIDDVQLIKSDRKILISKDGCPGQIPHLDSTAPLLISAMYFHDSLPQTESTIFHETNKEVDENHVPTFGGFRELVMSSDALDHAYSIPWIEHQVLFDGMVEVGSVALFSAGIIHRGPPVQQKGLRCVLFQPCVAGNITIEPHDYENQVYEFTYADYRYNNETCDQRDILSASLYRHRDEWPHHVTSKEQLQLYRKLQRQHQKRLKEV